MTDQNPSTGIRAHRRALMAITVVAMFLAGYALLAFDSDAATSKVVISADHDEKGALEETTVYFTVSLYNSDTEWSSQTVKMYANWLSGNAWTWEFTKGDGSALDPVYDTNGQLIDNGVTISQDSTVDIRFQVDVPAASAGQSQTITILGVDNHGSFNGNTTKQDDGTDLTLTLLAVKEHEVEISIDDDSKAGDSIVYSGEAIRWGYTIENTGWLADEYTVEVIGPAGWNFNPGMAPGTSIPGQSTTDVSHKYIGEVIITPDPGATPGNYDIIVEISGSNGRAREPASASAEFTVTIIAPDLQITDLSFSHASAWITSQGKTQTVTIYATVLNSGGNVDSTGATVGHVDVWFTVEGTTVGVEYVETLSHGEEATVSVTFEPTNTAGGDLLVQAAVDIWNNQSGDDPQDLNIQESDEGNNAETASFKVVRTKVESPSFYMGFAALTAAIVSAVALSAWLRRRQPDDDDE